MTDREIVNMEIQVRKELIDKLQSEIKELREPKMRDFLKEPKIHIITSFYGHELLWGRCGDMIDEVAIKNFCLRIHAGHHPHKKPYERIKISELTTEEISKSAAMMDEITRIWNQYVMDVYNCTPDDFKSPWDTGVPCFKIKWSREMREV